VGAVVMACDKWDGVLSHEEEFDNPSQGDFDRALDNMDARIHTMVTLQTEDQRQMIIGGGAGQYVVCATFGKDEFWSLLRPEPGESIVMLNAGGQEGDYPERQVVDKERARRAAHAFLVTRELDPALLWERT